jgi:hypothetical protein
VTSRDQPRAFRLMLACAVAAALVAPFAVAAWAHDDDRRPVTLAPVQAWLVNRDGGTLTLVDGPSASWAAEVRLPVTSSADVAQHGGTAVAAERGSGLLKRVDGRTHGITTVPVVNPAGTPLRLVASGATVYLHPGAAGRPHEVEAGMRVSAATAPARLAATGGTPVVADPDADRLTWPDGSAMRTALDDDAAVAGDAATGDVYLARPADRVVERCRAGSGCTTVVRLAGDTGSLGTPVVAAGRLLIPDARTGDLLVADLPDTDGVVTGTRPLGILGSGADLELVEQQGWVFVNDAGSDRAAVVSPDLAVTTLLKRPTGTGTPATSLPTPPPEPPPTVPPPSPPTTTSPTEKPADTPTTDPTKTPRNTTQPTTDAPPSGRPTATTRTRPPKPPPTTRTTPAPPDDRRVRLSVRGGVRVTTTVAAEPDDDETYWLVVTVYGNTSEDSVEHYARWEVDDPPGDSTTKTLTFPESADLSLRRTAVVIAASPALAAVFREQVESDPETTQPYTRDLCCKASRMVPIDADR